MNTGIISNYSKLNPRLFILPILLLIIIVLFMISKDAFSVNGYAQIQKDSFFLINHNLGQYPALQLNLTQIGDTWVFLSLLSIFVIYAPKIWESLISGLLISALLCNVPKKIFRMPRPAAVFDNDSFFIIGRRLTGSNSLPSGHSITIFTILTVFLFAFMPQKLKYKIIWTSFLVIIGLILAFSRVGVGAHYPIDVLSGSIIGYISGLSGIFFSRKYTALNWVGSKRYYPVFILLFLISGIVLISKIMNENLIIFYLAFACLLVSLYKIINIYAKK